MAVHSDTSSHNEITTSLCPFMSGETEATNMSQLKFRLKIIESWFGDLFSASTALTDSTILELGCGQGDMTLPLAHFARKVFGLDPGPLDYGSPLTLGQAQDQISKSEFGRNILWVQSDSIEYIQKLDVYPEYIVLAHSIWYFASENYFFELLEAMKVLAANRKDGKTTKLLIAEWGMQSSTPAAEAHVLAAKAQATNPQSDGNVRTIIVPASIKKLAAEASWKIEKEAWIESPDVEDGKWEVDLARIMAYEEKTIEEGPELLEMERAVEKLQGENIRSMDVWTGVFAFQRRI